MKVPRLLLVVLVVLLAFGVGSCGIAVLRSDEPVSPDGIPDILEDVVPDPPPVESADLTTCAATDAAGAIDFSGACRVSVAAASGSVRRLSLRNDGASGVRIELSEPASAERDLDPGDTEDIDVPPDERAEVDLVCLGLATCRVTLGA
jgi:hypothetical protein